MKHHTWTDWDWSDANWHLTNSIPGELPDSLTFDAPSLTICLCKLPDSLNLPQGKLVFSHYFEGSDYAAIIFRNQAQQGVATFINCYWVKITENSVILYQRVSGINTQLAAWTPINDPNTGRNWIITWWVYKAPNQPDVLRIHIHGNPAGHDEWETQFDDPTNLWVTSSVNRAGVGGLKIGADREYYDYTEVWKPQD